MGRAGFIPREALLGGISKVIFLFIHLLGNPSKRLSNGSKDDLFFRKQPLGHPHEGPFVEFGSEDVGLAGGPGSARFCGEVGAP